MEERQPVDASRRTALLGVKLRALVGDHLGEAVTADPEGVSVGVALLHGESAWVLVDGDASRSLGPALAWAIRRGATTLDVVAETNGGMIARRSAGFTYPISVWFPHERTLLPTVAEPLAAPPTANEDHLALRELIVAAGAAPNIEHGVVFGEVRGLEVCRVVDRATVGFLTESGVSLADHPGADDVGVRLEVGVGAADREAFQMLHGDIPTKDALAAVVSAVVRHRASDSLQHPLNRLGRERYLRWCAEQQPDSVGMVDVRPAEPPIPRPNLKDPVPCVAAGNTAGDQPSRLVFSSGVDLDLLPYIVDVQASTGHPVVAVLPDRDVLPLTRDLAGLLVAPIDFVALG